MLLAYLLIPLIHHIIIAIYNSKKISVLILKKAQVFCRNIIQYSLVITLCLMALPVKAVDTGALDVAVISGEGWRLEGVKLALINLKQKKPQFKMSATTLSLPKPFADVSLANIHCADFTWNKEELHCKSGKVSVKSKYWQSPSSEFSFHLGPKQNTFTLTDARIAGSRLSLVIDSQGNKWHSKLEAKQLSNDLLAMLLANDMPKGNQKQAKPAVISLTGALSGSGGNLEAFDLRADISRLTDQTQDGKIAAEKLKLRTHFIGKKNKVDWHWQGESEMTAGALFVDPVYLEITQRPISLKAQGLWISKTKIADVHSFTYLHPEAGRLTGSGSVYYHDKLMLDKANLALQSNTLQSLLATYASPFFTESPFTGMTVTGDLQGNFTFVNQALTSTTVNLSKLKINDESKRLGLNDGFGSLNWSSDPLEIKQSELSWRELTAKGLPLAAAKLKFTSQANSFKLTDKIKIPFFDGQIAVDKFSWQGKQGDEPNVSFAGAVDDVSLEALSKAMGWTPLLGKVSGQVPGVDYHNKTLSLDAELVVNVFDGVLRIKNLAASGLFTQFPKVSADIAIDKLDLDQLTRKFEFGNITGRMSGYVNKLVLENWRPVTFFAWLGTPEGDDSSHRISQKAVKNIASIGGGAATDLLSRSFLGFFETFGYDKIGVGCYLHKGVCQMMGLEATEQGYYLIKGGGLPRIDVLGYNPQVNWDVLVERLGRVAAPDKVIVQ